ncbi:MAG TPA: hypothetical protein VN811_16015, partial [Thermoanaerobaculia bacterium]|nr:hypothetical protein [Thermoanaerobaculia bacterium]
WIAAGRVHDDPPARRRTTGALIAVTLLVPVLLLGTFLLARAGGRQRGLTIMNPGAVFYEGNGPGATGLTRFAPPAVLALEAADRSGYDYGHVAYRRVAAFALAAPSTTVSAAVSNRYWTRLAWEGIRARQGRALARFARKAALALGPYEAHDLVPAEQLDRRLRRRLPWGFFVPLVALPWIALAGAGRRRELAGPLAVAALAFAVQVALYASARQRLPLALALWIIGPVLAADLARGRLTSAVRPALVVFLGLAVALGCAGLSARPALLYQRGWADALGPEPPSVGARLTAWSEGRGLRNGLARDARRLDAGIRLAKAGRSGQSLHVLAPLAGRGEDLTGADARVGVAEYWLARDLLALGHREPAAQAARDALAIRPEDPRVAALALRLARPRGAPEPAAWRPPGTDPVSAAIARAGAAAADGDPAAAHAILRPLVARFPELDAAPSASAATAAPASAPARPARRDGAPRS